MKRKKSAEIESVEIDPEKWTEFEATLKRALDMPHKPHQPIKNVGAKKRKSVKQGK
jgi:hypothetical protein